MKIFALLCSLLFSASMLAQQEQLAQNYFDKGEFEKARVSYEELVTKMPSNNYYFLKLVETYQQLQQYDLADKLIQQRLSKFKAANLLVELGYNYQLKKDDARAKKYYNEAIDRIKENPNDVYSVGPTFEKKALIDYALQAYQIAVELDPNLNFYTQMALLYGQSGNTELMISTFLDEAYRNPHSSIMIQNNLSRFMASEEGETVFNDQLRKALLTRAQKNQDIFWNEYLSWFFVQQKEYGKAFIQEKAIYRRNPETFSNIVNLAELAIEEKDDEVAKEILTFVLENTQDQQLLVEAHTFLQEMKIKSATEKDHKFIDSELQTLVTDFGISPNSLPLQILQAHFVTFNLNNPERGKAILKAALALQLNRYQTAEVKMELADILLFEEKFNQALLYYSQIEEELKNDAVGHEASLKAAKTSYFKADFQWAIAQFKGLKTASSQLIANDALEYFLLLNDNTVADSTQTALKQFARGDYLLYQGKNNEALQQFQLILDKFKGQEIEPVTLLRLGQTYEKLNEHNMALAKYQSIIDNHKEAIYIDEALYYSAEIYKDKLKEPEKAKALYEQLLFGHEDSIYFIDARKKFRQLRGDSNL
ncbi:MAG TPA: tetratricopeptide repeat protein [Flavobacterium sp.]